MAVRGQEAHGGYLWLRQPGLAATPAAKTENQDAEWLKQFVRNYESNNNYEIKLNIPTTQPAALHSHFRSTRPAGGAATHHARLRF